jgi:hypothetical protein
MSSALKGQLEQSSKTLKWKIISQNQQGTKGKTLPCVGKDLRTPGARRGSSGCHLCGECCLDGFAAYVHVSKQRVNIYTLTFKIDLRYDGGEAQRFRSIAVRQMSCQTPQQTGGIS